MSSAVMDCNTLKEQARALTTYGKGLGKADNLAVSGRSQALDVVIPWLSRKGASTQWRGYFWDASAYVPKDAASQTAFRRASEAITWKIANAAKFVRERFPESAKYLESAPKLLTGEKELSDGKKWLPASLTDSELLTRLQAGETPRDIVAKGRPKREKPTETLKTVRAERDALKAEVITLRNKCAILEGIAKDSELSDMVDEEVATELAKIKA